MKLRLRRPWQFEEIVRETLYPDGRLETLKVFADTPGKLNKQVAAYREAARTEPLTDDHPGVTA